MNKEQRITLARIICAAVLCVAAMLFKAQGLVRVLTFALPYLIIGYDVLWGAVKNILHGELFDEEFLMSVATIGAFATGDYPEASAVMIFFQVGELFEDIAVGRSRKSIAALMDIRPDYAVVLRDGTELTVPPEQVAIGETIIIKPGEKVPLDGEIIEGETSVNTSALTGESLPVSKRQGDRIISGSINLTGLVTVRTESSFGESTVSKILELVENSSEKKAKAENFITRFSRYYTPCVVFGALLLAVIPPLLFTGELGVWINRALIFLVVSCPCALVISVPLTFFAGIGGASREGILIKGANYLEVLSKVDTVVFDKTGTLTKGVFAVDAIHPKNISEAELLDITAAAESYSSHPVAESIIAAHNGHIDKSRLGGIEEIAGKGLKAQVDGKSFYVGNGSLMDSVGADWHECHLPGTVIHIAQGSEYMGHIVINDKIKPDSASAIAALKSLGIKRTVMLTGDSNAVAERVGSAAGVDEIRAQLLPADKVSAVEELLSQGCSLAFAGDGINDAPVLARSDVGIAMGALGSDAAIESADIVLMDDKPSKLPCAITIARKTMRIVRENIVFALAVKAIILLLSALGLTNMWIAVFGDVGVMILATLNAMRAMLKTK